MRDESLFYRPASTLLTTIRAYTGGPTPSRSDDPAIRFHPGGVTYHQTYRRLPAVELSWPRIRAVAVLPGPIAGREALCVYPLNEPPEPEVQIEELFTGTGRGLGMRFEALFGTRYSVHLHHVRGPSLIKLARHLPAWTSGRVRLTTERPS
ncbi:hypothetical protein [Streptomyces microflavus]|uniref:hypothetical protein n=1 Tax=Streptomyces microflavus TaxID=1919 RepID=UPI0033A04548